MSRGLITTSSTPATHLNNEEKEFIPSVNMALSSCPPPVLIGDSSLGGWMVIGSGGFGQIYKARHQRWCYDVAIKLLHYDDGTSSSLLREVKMMRQGSSDYVMQVLGVFKGRLPNAGPSEHLGLVMKFMEKGSLVSLQETLHGTLPWPLVFRLAYQVALGINFLHSQIPALLHLDLKPSNVLLDSHLNVKLTDFGLAKFYHSVTRVSKRDGKDEGGTISYMPPEAFELSYHATPASDIYSYGILLWSIVTGKQPYANAMSSRVRLCIPRGDRPSLEEFRCPAAGCPEVAQLRELMMNCWEACPTQRPSSYECANLTEKLYTKQKNGIVNAVHHILKKMEQKEEEGIIEQIQRVEITEASSHPRVEAPHLCDKVLTGRPPVQEVADCWSANHTGNAARVKDLPPPQQTNVSHVGRALSSSNPFEVKASSVHPVSAAPRPPLTQRSPAGGAAADPQRPLKPNLHHNYQRQFSSPGPSSENPPMARKVSIHESTVIGLQFGNHNTMYINGTDHPERKRHPTAPPSITLPRPRSGSRTNNSGGLNL